MTDTPHRIELKLRDVRQLFNTMDPSPFHERDLDDDAEEYIASWAQEYPSRAPVELVVHLAERVPEGGEEALIRQAVHHYFAYRARLNDLDRRRLLAEGWRSLLIGLGFLSLCLTLASRLPEGEQAHTLFGILRESLTIGGWVAMWRPMEIYLYEWWPLLRRGRIFRKLSHMPISVRTSAPDEASSR